MFSPQHHIKSGVVVHTCIPSTDEVEAGASKTQKREFQEEIKTNPSKVDAFHNI